MKLSSDKIGEILDSATNYIYDDLWNEFSEIWVEDYLSDINVLEYDKEDVNIILDELKEAQKQFQQEELEDEKQSLKQDIDTFIDEYSTHLGLTDIGVILVDLANSYLQSYE